MARRSSKGVDDAAASRRETVTNVDSDTDVSNLPASQQEYLAAELGHSVDHEGEPFGLDLPLLRRDSEFRKFTLSLWRQFQADRTVKNQARELEQEGLTNAELWEPGVTEFLPTSSTPEQMRRYKQKLLFRANFLEAMLTETIADLKKLDRAKPTATEQQASDPAPARRPGANGPTRTTPAGAAAPGRRRRSP